MTINTGLLGAGWFGREAHLKNLLRLPDVRVVAASSRSRTSRDAAQQLVGGQLQVFEDWRDVLKVGSLDAVIIALTNDQHHAAATAALRAGLHVLCEKPLGISIAECDEIINASTEAEKTLQVGHEMRFQCLYQRIKALVDSGAVGDPQIMWCREYRGPMRPGWRSSQKRTGGLLLEKNCHHFDLFNWILNTQPVRVAAFGGKNVLMDSDLPDNAQVLVEYKGDRRSVLEICLFAPAGSDCEIGVVGSGGRIDSKNQTMQLLYHGFNPPEEIEEQLPDADDESGFTDASGRIDRGIRAELAHFLECCRSGATPLNDGAAARWNVAVCLAAQKSILRREVVTIEEILCSQTSARAV